MNANTEMLNAKEAGECASIIESIKKFVTDECGNVLASRLTAIIYGFEEISTKFYEDRGKSVES